MAHNITASMVLAASDPIETFDREHPDGGKDYRIAGFRIGDLTVHVGLWGGDAEIVTETNRLIDALAELRDDALLRQDIDAGRAVEVA